MPSLERLLAALAEEVAQGGPGTIPPSLETLDVRMADAVRTDAAAIFAGILSNLGQSAPYGKPSCADSVPPRFFAISVTATLR